MQNLKSGDYFFMFIFEIKRQYFSHQLLVWKNVQIAAGNYRP